MIYSRCAWAYAAVGLTAVCAVTAQPAGVPVATAVTGTAAMCSAAGVEYSGRWSTPDNRMNAASLEDCAAMCEADAVCTGATWIEWEEGNTAPDNCFFKAWPLEAAAVPCQPDFVAEGRSYAALISLPTGITSCDAITYLPGESIGCLDEKDQYGEFSGSAAVTGGPAQAPVEEMPPLAAPPVGDAPVALGPMSVGPLTVAPAGAVLTQFEGLDLLDPPYIAYTGADYSANQLPPPALPIANVKPGVMAESVLACATLCNEDPTCNAASYYGNNPPETWPADVPCWLKVIGVPCELPADYFMTEEPNSVFMLAQDNCGAVAPMDMLMPGMAPMELAPTEGPLMVTPLAGPVEGPAAGPVDGPLDGTREFDISLAPVGGGFVPTAAGGPAPGPVEPIQGPLLTTDVPAAPLPAASPPDAGIGLATGPEVPDLDETSSPEASSIDVDTGAAAGLPAAASAAAVVVGTLLLLA